MVSMNLDLIIANINKGGARACARRAVARAQLNLSHINLYVN
jgi:hypothetical protein